MRTDGRVLHRPGKAQARAGSFATNAPVLPLDARGGRWRYVKLSGPLLPPEVTEPEDIVGAKSNGRRALREARDRGLPGCTSPPSSCRKSPPSFHWCTHWVAALNVRFQEDESRTASFATGRYWAATAKKLAKLPSYRISPAKSSGFIAMNNAIMRPRAKPTIVPATTPRQSTFCSPFVILHLQGLPPRYHYPRANDQQLQVLGECSLSDPFESLTTGR